MFAVFGGSSTDVMAVPLSSSQGRALSRPTYSDNLDESRKTRESLPSPLPPKWMPDSQTTSCTICQESFSFWNRRHHCRLCGLVICIRCSGTFALLPTLGYTSEVRVCDSCAKVLSHVEELERFLREAVVVRDVPMLISQLRELNSNPLCRDTIDRTLLQVIADIVNEWAKDQYYALSTAIKIALEDDHKVAPDHISELYSKAIRLNEDVASLGLLKLPPPPEVAWEDLVKQIVAKKAELALELFLERKDLHSSDVFGLKTRIHHAKLWCANRKDLIWRAECALKELEKLAELNEFGGVTSKPPSMRRVSSAKFRTKSSGTRS